MSTPRVLLVEDDASLRRFVAMALEEHALELLQADTVAAALRMLAEQSVQLVITDLMMPGESGLDLLRHLQQQPALRGNARVAVMSAGLTAPIREQLQAFDVWRLLHKPVPLMELQACVADALAASGMPLAPAAALDASALTAEQQEACKLYFGGNQALFVTYLAACRKQFPQDVATADAALAAGDAGAVQRVAHSLKAVLLSIGHADISAHARALEQATATHGLAPPAAAQWHALKQALLHAFPQP